MNTTKRACLVYVPATANMRLAARARLEAEGYEICEVLAEIETAIAAEAGESDLPSELKDCIASADLCVFLLPESAMDDGCIAAGSGLASELGKRSIAVVDGAREALPQPFDLDGAGVVRDCDDGLADAIRGDASFTNADGSKAASRTISHVKCQ